MTARATVYHCKSCGYESSSMLNRCPSCRYPGRFTDGAGHKSGMVRDLVAVPILEIPKISTTAEIDEALDGGVVRGGVYLVGGEPGIGKSTLFLQLLCKLPKNEGKGLYISGEEAVEHVRMRAQRCELDIKDVRIVEETDKAKIEKIIADENPAWCVLDSISIMGNAPDQLTIVKALYILAHKTGMAIFIICHVTKDGDIAGPKALEHAVDCRIDFEGERDDRLRVLKTVKNRFGTVPRMGLLEMTPTGLIDRTEGASFYDMQESVAGSAIAIAWQDGRPILIEVQATVTPSEHPKSIVAGTSQKRVQLVVATLYRVKQEIFCSEIYVAVPGGMQFNDPALDLPIALAIQSAKSCQPLPVKTAWCGEIDLVGRVRSGLRFEERKRYAERLGFELRSAETLLRGIQFE